jgi:hypothetical protein
MGADRIIAFYGVRLPVAANDENTIAALEARTDPRGNAEALLQIKENFDLKICLK